MAAQQTNLAASGGSTPEGKLAITTTLSGLAVALLGGLAPFLTQLSQQYPNLIWFQLGALAVGSLLASAGSHHLTVQQTSLKTAWLDALKSAEADALPKVGTLLLQKALASLQGANAAATAPSGGTTEVKVDPAARAK